MAAPAEIPHLVLTHLIPPVDSPEQAEAFSRDVRSGGFEGELTVGVDLACITLG